MQVARRGRAWDICSIIISSGIADKADGEQQLFIMKKRNGTRALDWRIQMSRRMALLGARPAKERRALLLYACGKKNIMTSLRWTGGNVTHWMIIRIEIDVTSIKSALTFFDAFFPRQTRFAAKFLQRIEKYSVLQIIFYIVENFICGWLRINIWFATNFYWTLQLFFFFILP